MATLTIRDLDEEVKRRLRVRAAGKGVSMEAEARSILAEAVTAGDRATESPGDWYRRFRERVGEYGGVDLTPYLIDRGLEETAATSRRTPFSDDA